MGTGYILFNAVNGQFAGVDKVMPAGSMQKSEYSILQSYSCGFHFFVNNGGTVSAKQKATTTNEDAKLPQYTANFGTVGGCNFSLLAFGPYIAGDNPLYLQLAQSPLAYFDITVTNNNATAVDAAAALEFANSATSATGANLLGGVNTGAGDTNNGLTNAITWSGGTTALDTTEGNAYLLVSGDKSADTFTTGSMGSYLTTGKLTQGAGNIVAGKVNIPAGGTAHFRFVMAWWVRWINATRGAEDHYYQNYYANSKAAANFGMSYFTQVEAGVTSMVSRVMGSNFPTWYKDRLLNNLYPLVKNSDFAKDGRAVYWEGCYPILGTIDQSEHASLFYTFCWPSTEWRELQFWARSSHLATEAATPAGALCGQVHHDVNGVQEGSWSYASTDQYHFMFPWNNTTHVDYSAQPNTTDWADLQCYFIFKAYELMLATGSMDSLAKYYDSLRNSANRTIIQCASTHLPTASQSTYDNGQDDPMYVSGMCLAAWEAFIQMATWMKDTASVTKFTAWYDSGRAQYRSQYFTASFATGTIIAEGDVAGYVWAHYLGLPAIFDSVVIATGCQRLWAYYSPNSKPRSVLGQWSFYTYDHWGGSCIAIGHPNTAMLLQWWDWDWMYAMSPAFVYWQSLNGTNTDYCSYVTSPIAWRSYWMMTGVLLDNVDNRLWIRPEIPDTSVDTMMPQPEHVLKNCPIINPHGWGNLNYTDSVVGTRIQRMTVSFDSLVTIKQFVLKNNATVQIPGVTVTNNGVGVAAIVTRDSLASPFEKVFRVTLASPIQIGPQGVTIQVFNGPAVGIAEGAPSVAQVALGISNNSIAAGALIHYSVGVSGSVTMDLFAVNGVKLGTIMKANVSAGNHSFVWNGQTSQGMRVNAEVAVLRLSTSNVSVSKKVFILK
jgi:hypothetical protein